MVIDDWDAELEQVLETLPPLPVLPPEALSRESTYDDGGRIQTSRDQRKRS